ncbi:hypothetical protein LINGRAHAP2_LOCUS26536 [Linum grandiflorum]
MATTPILTAAGLILILSTSSAIAEPENYRCYEDPSGHTLHECDPGRCCSFWNYCSDDPVICSTWCQFQCTSSSSSHRTGVNAASYDEYYHDVVVVNRTSAEEEEEESLSCGTSSVMMNHIPGAAFGRSRRNDAASSICGQCLKVIKLLRYGLMDK